jgi:hypothetical protein
VSKRVNSKAKGIRGELEAAKLWRRWFPDARRSFGQARNGYEQPDIIGGPEKHFYVEVKRARIITDGMIEKWWEKVIDDERRYREMNNLGETPLVVVLMFREDDEDWLIKVPGTYPLIVWCWFAEDLDKRFLVEEVLT